MQVESDVAKIIIKKKKKPQRIGHVPSRLWNPERCPAAWGAAGAQAAFRHFWMQRGRLLHQWIRSGSALGSSGLPVRPRAKHPGTPSSPAGERCTSGCTFPSPPPPQARQGINEQVWKPEELSAKACAGCLSMQELEQSLADWAHDMKELRAMKVELAHCILTEDMMVLKEQVDHLHRQWEELCLRVSLLPPLGFYSGIFVGPGRKGERVLGVGSLFQSWVGTGLLLVQLTRAEVCTLFPGHRLLRDFFCKPFVTSECLNYRELKCSCLLK